MQFLFQTYSLFWEWIMHPFFVPHTFSLAHTFLFTYFVVLWPTSVPEMYDIYANAQEQKQAHGLNFSPFLFSMCWYSYFDRSEDYPWRFQKDESSWEFIYNLWENSFAEMVWCKNINAQFHCLKVEKLRYNLHSGLLLWVSLGTGIGISWNHSLA